MTDHCENCGTTENIDTEYDITYCIDCIEEAPWLLEKIQAEMAKDWQEDHPDESYIPKK